MSSTDGKKREYVAPSIEDYGRMHELTLNPDKNRGNGGKKPFGVVDGPHGPKRPHQLGS